MNAATSALTGHLPFDLLAAAILTWPVASILLRLYSRAVQRSMRSQSAHGVAAMGVGAAGTPESMPVASVATLRDLPDAQRGPADRLFRDLVSRPARSAMVYAAAGCVYGLIMAVVQLLAAGIEILPIRLGMYFLLFSWPVVIAVSIVATTTVRGKAMLVATYFAAIFALGAVAMPRSPDLTWGQVFIPWLIYDLPPTILLLTYLSRRVRAVGPMVLTFMFLALVGSDLVVSFVGSRDSYGRALVSVAGAFGIGGTGAFIMLIGVGFLLFMGVGWVALTWIRRRYLAKAIGDESLTLDAVWMFFTIVYAVDLAFESPWWVFAGLVAFAAYKTIASAGLAWLGRRDRGTKPPVLLLLRSFSIGRDAERLFDALDKHWRRVGSIQMIAGVDLDKRTIEPHEFLDFVSGKLSRRFIDGEAGLSRRMRECDRGRDRDLRFRVNEFFCYDDTWKMVLSRLVHETDAVLMDLRGFSSGNAGCLFELHELSRLVPLERVVFVVDARTDEALLARTLGGGRAGVFRQNTRSGRNQTALLRALADAATVSP